MQGIVFVSKIANIQETIWYSSQRRNENFNKHYRSQKNVRNKYTNACSQMIDGC